MIFPKQCYGLSSLDSSTLTSSTRPYHTNILTFHKLGLKHPTLRPPEPLSVVFNIPKLQVLWDLPFIDPISTFSLSFMSSSCSQFPPYPVEVP